MLLKTHLMRAVQVKGTVITNNINSKLQQRPETEKKQLNGLCGHSNYLHTEKHKNPMTFATMDETEHSTIN